MNTFTSFPFLRRILCLGVAAGVLVSSALAEEAPKPRIALVMKSLANEFFLTMQQGAEENQRQRAGDYTLLSNGIKDEIDTVGQIKLVEQMIVSKVDAIVIAPADSKALVRTVQRAIEAGIIVINIDNRFDPEVLKAKKLNVPFVGPDNRKGARLVGEYLAKSLKAGDQVAIIEGVPTTTNAQDRTQGFKDAMEAAGIKVVSVQSGNWEMQRGNAIASAILREYPGLKALLCDNDGMALGAVSAVRTSGRAGQVQVVGYDNVSAVKPLLLDGRMLATADQYAARQAIFGIEIALKAIKDKTPQAKLDSVVETPVELVTAASAP